MTLALTQTTPPAKEPLTTAEAKLFLRVGNDAENDAIDRLIASARATIEAWTGRQLIDATWTWTLDRWPAFVRPWSDGPWDVNRGRTRSEFRLPHSPLASVTSVKYIDTNGTQQTLTGGGTDYDVVTDEEPGKVRLAYDQSWPEIRDQLRAVEIIYVAGYGTEGSDVPAAARDLILMAVEDVYNHRAMNVERAMTANPAASGLLDAIGRVEIIG